VFAGEARLLVPLTRDRASLAALVGQADPLAVARGGSSLGPALQLAAGALASVDASGAAVLLLTDGDDADGTGARAAAALHARGIAVHCVGYGTARGAKIPVDGGGGGETYLRDRDGREVVTALDAEVLRTIARTTGGAYAEAGGVAGLYEREILPIGRAAVRDAARRERANRFRWPLAGAFFLWILELWRGGRRRG
jgi:Ca-activated chloride channel family protein